jgi:hypothetical protein
MLRTDMKKKPVALGGKSRLRTVVEAASWIAGILSLLVAVYVIYQAEHSKELTITYAPKRPLVSVDPLKSNQKMEVNIAGTRVSAPWLVSARLENSGNQPIEARDLEALPKFKFEGTKVVNADVISKSDPSIFAQTTVSDDTVSVEHKLLNSGDWIDFDILLDGEPSLPPRLSLRIVGISKAKQTVISSGGKEIHLAPFDVSKNFFLPVLVFSSLIPLLLLFLGLYYFYAGISQFFQKSFSGLSEQESQEEQFIRSSLEKMSPMSSTAKILCSGMDRQFSLQELDDHVAMENLVAFTLTGAIFVALNLNPSQAAEIVSKDLKNSLKAIFADRIWGWVKNGNDERKQVILEIDVAHTTAKELCESAHAIYLNSIAPVRKISEANYDYLFNAVFVLLTCASISLVLGGAWRNFFAA